MYRPLALGQLTDELGKLEAELSPHRAKIARVDAIRKTLRAAFAGVPTTEVSHVAGVAYECYVGACSNVSVVDTALLIEHVGLAPYAAVATVTIGAIEKNWPDALATVVHTKQAGTRPLTVSKLPETPAIARAALLAKPADAVSKTRKRRAA